MQLSHFSRIAAAIAIAAVVVGCSANKPKSSAKAATKKVAPLSDASAAAEYQKILPKLLDRYNKSGNQYAQAYTTWQSYNTVPYVSGTHGKRHVNNFANAVAAATYGQYEGLTVMPVGSVLAKDSFKQGKNGKINPGPLFLMEKMEAGFNPATSDWRYSAVMPNGKMMGVTNGDNAKKVEFCHACHAALGAKTDMMTFLPAEYRK